MKAVPQVHQVDGEHAVEAAGRSTEDDSSSAGVLEGESSSAGVLEGESPSLRGQPIGGPFGKADACGA